MTQMDESTVVDFRQVFESFPGNLLLLAAAPPSSTSSIRLNFNITAL